MLNTVGEPPVNGLRGPGAPAFPEAGLMIPILRQPAVNHAVSGAVRIVRAYDATFNERDQREVSTRVLDFDTLRSAPGAWPIFAGAGGGRRPYDPVLAMLETPVRAARIPVPRYGSNG